MSTHHPFGITAILVFLSATSLFAISAYGVTNDTNDTLAKKIAAKESLANETLDVNLNSIYLKNRSQKNFGLLNEIILQLPYPISETAKKTGKGPFGGITYFDDKALADTNTQHASVLGLGRIYYSTTVPGDTPLTFVPYLTFYRASFVDYKDPLGSTTEKKYNSWLTPGFMYAYRMQPKVVVHLDMEAYSYSKIGNNRARVGFSYMPQWPIILSTSYERVSWDLDQNVGGSDISMKGNSSELSAKIIIRNPPQGNFSLILGYGTLHNAAVPAFSIQSINSKGLYFGIEASAGVLAW